MDIASRSDLALPCPRCGAELPRIVSVDVRENTADVSCRRCGAVSVVSLPPPREWHTNPVRWLD